MFEIHFEINKIKLKMQKKNVFCVVCFWHKHYLIQRPFVDFTLILLYNFSLFLFCLCFDGKIALNYGLTERTLSLISFFSFLFYKMMKSNAFFFLNFVFVLISFICSGKMIVVFLGIVIFGFWINFFLRIEIKVKLFETRRENFILSFEND